ncbi:hypothetical protein EJ08DRAFT_719493 [Tothia fuscella]|uniref:Uncharacterized protein n=1 Tax=Tothia fuscella TaxID=1048955 RepID=A0A9P4NMY3_9PEZI|nr:hypothetical protein EJ08DRAFT_719493 [Tothia fuscella]
MPSIRYTVDQLHGLRASPLVKKPDGLPSIEQWMEPVAQENGRRKQSGRDENVSHLDGAPLRPLLGARHSARNSEDVVLGPPKMGFTSSSRNQNRISDSQDKVDKNNSATFGDDATPSDRTPNIRDKYFGRERDTRDGERPVRGERNALQATRRNGRDEEGGWNSANRPRRGSQQEDGGDRWQRPDRNDRNKDTDGLEDTSRRNGAGRGGRLERTRGREEQHGDGDTARTAGNSWRDRTREQERERERGEWSRGNKVQDRVEEDPAWASEAVEDRGAKKEKTQEDFQRWLGSMKMMNAATESQVEPVQSSPPDTKDGASSTKPTGITLDLGGMFNTWGAKNKTESKPSEDTAAQAPAPKATPAAGKSSRFNKYFQKEETPPIEPEQPPRPASGPNGNKTQEDTEGFNRILQMLNATQVGGPAPRVEAPPRARMEDQMFNAREQALPTSSRPDSAGLINSLLEKHAQTARSRGPQTAPVETEAATQYFPNSNGEYGRAPNGRDENTTPRTGNGNGGMFSPTIADQNGGQADINRNRDFLLSIIRETRQTQGPADPSDFAQFHLGNGGNGGGVANSKGGMRPQPQQLQQDPPQRMIPAAPPGLYNDPFPRREQEPEMHPLRKVTSRPQQQQMPPGFFDHPEQELMGGMPPGLHRRNTTDLQQRQAQPPMSNMGIPSQQAPADPFRMNHIPQGMPPQNGQEQRLPHNMAPPPGFDPRNMRPPPGFAQGLPQQMAQHGVHNAPIGHPGMANPRMFPQPPPGVMNLPPTGHLGGPPPGFFQNMLPPQPGMPPQGMAGGPPFSHRDLMMMQQHQQAAQARGQPFAHDGGRGGPPLGPPGFHM